MRPPRCCAHSWASSASAMLSLPPESAMAKYGLVSNGPVLSMSALNSVEPKGTNVSAFVTANALLFLFRFFGGA